jgi:hypothetical protein
MVARQAFRRDAHLTDQATCQRDRHDDVVALLD